MTNPLSNGLQYSVKLGSKPSFRVTRERTMASNYFHELVDTSFDGITRSTPNPNRENYLVTYNSTTNKFVIVDPDAVLVAAASTTSLQPGLPQPFLTKLGDDLDNEIDLDGGVF